MTSSLRSPPLEKKLTFTPGPAQGLNRNSMFASQSPKEPTRLTMERGRLPQQTAYRERMTKLLQEAAPEKISQIDSIMARYAGKEDEMLQNYTAACGKGDSRGSPRGRPSQADVGSLLAHREKLTKLLEETCPHKVEEINDIMQQFQGREEEMISKYVAKDGPEPTKSLMDSASPAPRPSAKASVPDGSPKNVAKDGPEPTKPVKDPASPVQRPWAKASVPDGSPKNVAKDGPEPTPCTSISRA